MEHDNNSKLVTMRITPVIAEKKVREIAQSTENVVFTIHAQERMAQRDIADFEVFQILRSGHVEDIQNCRVGEGFECKITKKLPGRREAGVVTAVKDKEGILVIITVEWEDLR